MNKFRIRTYAGVEHTIEVYNDGWQWAAVEENYDGPEDKYRARHGSTREEAIENLRESLEEHDSKWNVPNEYDWLHPKMFVFKFRDHRIEIGPMEGLTYAAALSMAPIGAELLCIHKHDHQDAAGIV